MKVFLAGETDLMDEPTYGPLAAPWVRHRLFSYYYHGMDRGALTHDVRRAQALGMELFLDSGAFTAHTKGAEIDIERYAAFIREHSDVWSVRANLDVIGDTGPKSWANLKALESLGASVFPVFHYGDDEQYLTRILDEGYEFFALGGLVGGTRKVLQEWLDRIWTRYLVHEDGTPRRKVHGFGLTDQVLMLRYPWYSVDSASWLFSASFGSCVFARNRALRQVSFSDGSPDLYKADAWCWQNLPPAQQAEVASWLEPAGVSVEECATRYHARFVVNAMAYTELGKHAATRWHNVQETFW